MAPVDGVAVLAHGTATPPPDGTVVEALDASGKVIGSQDVNQQDPQKVISCAVASASGSGVAVPTVRSGPAPVPVPAPTTTR